MKIYMSSSIAMSPLNERLGKILEKKNHEVLLPQEFCPLESAHKSYPETIFQMCIDAMIDADMCLIYLDGYGRDSSWECGWFSGRGDPVIGFASSNLRFIQDWMIKGGISGIVTDNPVIHKAIKEDPILKNRLLVLIDSIDKLGETLSMMVEKIEMLKS